MVAAELTFSKRKFWAPHVPAGLRPAKQQGLNKKSFFEAFQLAVFKYKLEGNLLGTLNWREGREMLMKESLPRKRPLSAERGGESYRVTGEDAVMPPATHFYFVEQKTMGRMKMNEEPTSLEKNST